MHVDHVILACRDVDETARRLLETHGLGTAVGGEHPAWGTRNRVLPAGAAYVELMGVGDRAVAETTPLGQLVLRATTDGDRFIGLAVEPDDLAATGVRLGLAVSPGSRTRPDGREVTWRAAGMAEALVGSLPFFLAWDGPRGSEVAVEGGGRPAADLVQVDLGGDPAELAAWLGGDARGLVAVGGPPGVRRVLLAAEDGALLEL